jgi:hypothetical protein
MGGLCVAIWRAPVDRSLFEQQRAGLAEVVRANPDGAGFLCVVEKSSTPPPSEALRKASGQMIASHGSALKAVACVIEATGFSGSIIRGVLIGMSFFLPPRGPDAETFSNTRDAAEWLSRYVSFGPLDTFMIRLQSIRSQLTLPRAEL